MSVPNTFATATSPIPLANLDANFAYYDAAFSIVSTALSFIANPTLSAGTANGVTYLNGSKVLTSGTALTFDGTTLNSGGGIKVTGSAASFAVDGGTLDYTASITRLAAGRAGGNYGEFQLYVAGASGITKRFSVGYNSTFNWYDPAGTGQYMTLTSTGLGIGTSSPLNKLEVSATSAGGLGGVASISNPAAVTAGNAASLGFRPNTNFIAAGYYGARIAAETPAANNNVDLVFYNYKDVTASGDITLRIASSGAGTATADWTFNGVTVGRGAGAVATNTAVGAAAINAVTTATQVTGVGYQAARNTTTGANVAAFGSNAGFSNTTGALNAFLGTNAGYSNTTGGSNTAVGEQALFFNTTASNNTAVGYLAGYSNATGAFNAYFGYYSGFNTTGAQNTFIGSASGFLITSGAKNTILGQFSGNQGGLDIRTASNYIVLSDGDGNPRLYHNGTTIVIPNLPTSATGLPAGGLWKDASGFLKVA